MIIFSHGDKGGVGKSMAATMLVETLLHHNRPVLLVESDESTPDVIRRYENVVGVKTVFSNLNRAGDEINAVSDFAKTVDINAPSGSDVTVIVNLPGGAGETLDEQATMLVEVFAEIGTEIRVCYSLGDAPVQSTSLVQSFKAGLCGAVPAEHVQILLTGWSAPIENFAWIGMSERAQLRKLGLPNEYVVPPIQTAAVRPVVFGSTGRLTDLCETFHLMERAHFTGWMKRYRAALEPILGLSSASVVSIETASKKAGKP